MTVEKPDLTLGFIALADCAPLAVAADRGYFEEEGLNVILSREPSWANIRDKVAAGALDGAHMLGPMALAATLGLGGGDPVATIAPMALNLGGSAVTVSTVLAEALHQIDPAGMTARPRRATALTQIAAQRRTNGEPPLTFAVVFPYSVHNYELRHWLQAGGIDPDAEVRIIVVPPARMVESLAAGEIDGYCVGAPWNAVAVLAGVGEIMVHASQIWPRGPDKVFGVTEAWAARNPETLKALIRAMTKAAAWADVRENRRDLATLLAKAGIVGVAQSALELALLGDATGKTATAADDIIFHQGDAGRPTLEHEAWFLDHMARWGQIPRHVDIASIKGRVYRPDLYAAAFN